LGLNNQPLPKDQNKKPIGAPKVADITKLHMGATFLISEREWTDDKKTNYVGGNYTETKFCILHLNRIKYFAHYCGGFLDFARNDRTTYPLFPIPFYTVESFWGFICPPTVKTVDK
jgi:hypothetical protein